MKKWVEIITKNGNPPLSIVFSGLSEDINHATELIKRWGKHSFIFFLRLLRVSKKNERVFCAVAVF